MFKRYNKHMIIAKAGYENILIIEKDDIIPENIHYFKGKKYHKIFIHKDNKLKDEFKEATLVNTTVLGYKFGEYYEYN